MDFIDQIKAISARVAKLKDNCATEEASKQALILPFFQMLGWDIFNPEEFLPEFITDVGIKKGEKVDYAIVVDGNPTVLIECKWSGAPLDKHDSQLFRYFGCSTAKFAILTNGIVYKFYSDLDEPNKMDLTPFLEVDLLNLRETLVPEVKKFHKDIFDPESLATVASELKYSKAIKDYFAQQLSSPDDEFVRYFAGHVYDGVKTQAVMERFTGIVRASLNDFITERMNERLKTALGEGAPSVPKPIEEPPVDDQVDDEDSLEPTATEMEALFIIRALIGENIQNSDVTFRVFKGSFSVDYKGAMRKWICRFKLRGDQAFILIPDENKKGEWLLLERGLDSIYQYKEQLLDVLSRYVS